MSDLQLGFPFKSHLVLQQRRPNPIWGRDRPGQPIRVRVKELDLRVSTVADADGGFSVSCPPLPAGGPYTIVIEGSSEVVLQDVVWGEVWLASGQSNMEWTVGASASPDEAIANADDPLLRVLKVERRAAWEPTHQARGAWERTSPDSVSSFTGVGYYFARQLREHLRVPVGVIDCSWGGTAITSWMSRSALRSILPKVDAEIAALRAELPQVDRQRAAYQEVLAAWESRSFPRDPPNSADSKGFARPEFDDTDWNSLRLPAFWQHHGMSFNGVVWFRREVTVPEAWAGRDLVLSLGAIDDFDHTYVNGELVGSHPAGTPEAFQIPRRYPVPGRLVRAGRNLIAVRVFDHFGEGGFAGPARALRLELADASAPALPLGGAWRMFAEHPIPLVPASVWTTYPAPPILLTPQHIPGSLHNGMLAPVLPYALSGVLWYQGESDVDDHADYTRRQIALIRDLRSHFSNDALPFFLVELAGFRGGPHWPLLREAQQRARVDSAVHLATARDIGDADDIHPRNKQEVGRRLALVARAEVYGHDVVARGPELERAAFRDGAAHLSFRFAEGLRSRGVNRVAGFELAGSDGVFHAANAEIVGESVRVSASEVPHPTHVRYAFSDTGEGDLENGAGLPALSFRTDTALTA